MRWEAKTPLKYGAHSPFTRDHLLFPKSSSLLPLSLPGAVFSTHYSFPICRCVPSLPYVWSAFSPLVWSIRKCLSSTRGWFFPYIFVHLSLSTNKTFLFFVYIKSELPSSAFLFICLFFFFFFSLIYKFLGLFLLPLIFPILPFFRQLTSIYLTIYISINLSLHLSTYLSIYLSTYHPISPTTNLNLPWLFLPSSLLLPPFFPFHSLSLCSLFHPPISTSGNIIFDFYLSLRIYCIFLCSHLSEFSPRAIELSLSSRHSPFSFFFFSFLFFTFSCPCPFSSSFVQLLFFPFSASFLFP